MRRCLAGVIVLIAVSPAAAAAQAEVFLQCAIKSTFRDASGSQSSDQTTTYKISPTTLVWAAWSDEQQNWADNICSRRTCKFLPGSYELHDEKNRTYIVKINRITGQFYSYDGDTTSYAKGEGSCVLLDGPPRQSPRF